MISQTSTGSCVDDAPYGATVANCALYSSDIYALTGDPICVKCKEGFLPLIEIDDKNRKVSQYNIENDSYDQNNPVAQFQRITACEQYDDTNANHHILG